MKAIYLNFRPYFHYCLSSAHHCEDHFHSCLYPQFKYMTGYFKGHCYWSHAIKQYQQTFWNFLVWVEIFEHIHGKINLTIKIMNSINYGHIYICTYNLNGWKHFSGRQCVLVCCSWKPFKASTIFIFPLQSCKILLRMTRKLECYDSFRHNGMHLLHNFWTV